MMKVSASNWQSSAVNPYQASRTPESKSGEQTGLAAGDSGEDRDLLESASAQNSRSSAADKPGSGVKMKASGPDNSVGELASMLARAETVMDVQQVLGKAMRALAQLKMCAMCSEGKDAKKYAQQIKRMEKLIKRIQKKLKHLGKEQRIEDQRKRAEKKAEAEKEKQLREELRSRRRKRRRDELRYALKELSEDQKTETGELVSSVTGSMTGSSPSDLSSLVGSEGAAALFGGGAADFSGADGMSVDISV